MKQFYFIYGQILAMGMLILLIEFYFLFSKIHFELIFFFFFLSGGSDRKFGVGDPRAHHSV